jgi:NitT/TauT family transport system substrate-binding protein
MDAGVEDPMTAVEWVTGMSYPDALAALQRGEVDYALMGTGQNFQVQNMPEIEIMCYQGDVMPDYSCCRMEAPTEFVKNNPITIKYILKALIRAQAYYEANKEECVDLLAKYINADHDYVAAYMLNDYYKVHVDPLSNSIRRAWNILDKTGFLDENAKNINIDDHINTSIYEEALAECEAEFGAENPEFFASLNAYYAANNG